MCGIVAVLSKKKFGFAFKDKAIMLQMLVSDMFRGLDSTGVFGVNKHGNLEMLKDASSAPFFINKAPVQKFFDKFTSDLHMVVGHNRKATMGTVVSENAHPFIEGDICLVHNGTLQNHKKLADRIVDSNAVAAHINEHGYKSMYKTIEGAYALIWYNIAEKTLYISRNAERPLHLVETDDAIYIASEGKMLDWILDRNDVGKYTVQLVPTDKVFKFNLETKKLEAEYKPKKASVSGQNQSSNQQNSQNVLLLQNLTSGKPASYHPSGHTAAGIEDYRSGEQILWKCDDFDLNEHSTKLIGRTLDENAADVNIYLPHTRFSQKEIEKFINATALISEIASITWKRGVLTIFPKNVQISENLIDSNGVIISVAELEAAGEQCYCCNNRVKTAEEVSKSDIQTNKAGNIMYILCEDCVDSNTLVNYGRMH